MSKKRNIAAQNYKSDYIAFLDSDAYPNKNWLENANKLYNKKKNDVLGGPNIPFPNETKSEMLSHYCKRSFFVNGHLAYRKYLSKDSYIEDWLESCNFFINRNIFLKNKGMNEKLYIGEDQDFFKKLKKSTKVYFTRNLFVFHKDRNIKNFLIQRFCFGLDVFNGINFNGGLKGLIVLLPFITLLLFLIFLISPIKISLKILIMILGSLLFIFFIILDIGKYVKFRSIFKVVFFIIIANFIYAIAGFFALFGLRSRIERIFYRKSR
jgi:GT2 family glycosyltransferase